MMVDGVSSVDKRPGRPHPRGPKRTTLHPKAADREGLAWKASALNADDSMTSNRTDQKTGRIP